MASPVCYQTLPNTQKEIQITLKPHAGRFQLQWKNLSAQRVLEHSSARAHAIYEQTLN